MRRRRRCRRSAGRAAVLSGSCSAATNAQVQHWLAGGRPAFAHRRAARWPRAMPVASQALAWARARVWPTGRCWSTRPPSRTTVKAVQAELGVERAGALVEQCLARDRARAGRARRAPPGRGRRRDLGRGGAGARRARAAHRRRTIDPGVPWTAAPRAGRCCAGAEVGQLRRRRFLHARRCDAQVRDDRTSRRAARTRSAASAARCSSAATCMRPPATSACGCPTAAS